MKIFYLDRFTLWNYLETISITYAHLTRLSPVIFNRSLSFSPILHPIKTLNLSHNSLRIIDTNFSYYFPSLEILDLSFNQLILIRKKTFINLIHLQEIHLNNNYLKQISSDIFPRHILNIINLNSNRWHCSCKNVLILSISRPVIPLCQTPNQYKNYHADDIARQCFLRSKAIILITTNIDRNENLTCALSSTIDTWKTKINTNLTLVSAWHIEQHRPIAISYLHDLSNKYEKYLICFNLNSSQSNSIHTIIPLKSNESIFNHTKSLRQFLPMASSTKNQTFIIIKAEKQLPNIFVWLLNASKSFLPKSIQTSDRYVLMVWLILLTIVIFILSLLLYFLYRQKTRKNRHCQVTHYAHQSDKNSLDNPSLINLKCTCKHHKCLCQYNRLRTATIHYKELNPSKSIVLSNLESFDPHIKPSLIKPTELRYAKIKRISSIKEFDKDYLTGQFRTTVKLKSLPI